MIDQPTVQRIHETAQVIEVIGDFISLKKRGVNYLGLCPFHNEKSPSFTVSPAKGIYKCFGCGESGNSVGFVMAHEKLSYPEALKYVAKKYNIEIEEREQTPEQQQERRDIDSLYIVTEYAKKFFVKTLHTTDEGKSTGLSYFRERGFREDIIQKFELGWSPEKRDALTSSALQAGYKLKFMSKSGLSIVNTEKNYQFDRFAGRVIFPIKMLSGKTIAFGGRTLKQEKKIAKYLNSPESEIYHKSRVLYGMYHAKSQIVRQNECIMVEGYTDVISMHQAGIKNVVASSGTSLTVEQIRLVKRFTRNLTIIYDGDAAGIKASLRGIDLVLAEEMNVKVLLLPDGEDPDSFSKTKSPEELTTYIEENKQDFIKFKTKLLLADVKNDPVRRAQLVADIVASIAVIPSSILRSEYVKECSHILNVREEAIYSEIKKRLAGKLETAQKNKSYKKNNVPSRGEKENPALNIQGNTPALNEKNLLYFLLNFGEEVIFPADDDNVEMTVAEYITEEITADELEFTNQLYGAIFIYYAEFIKRQEHPKNEFFLQHKNTSISKVASDLLSPNYELSKLWDGKGGVIGNPEDNLPESIPDALDRFKLASVLQMIKDVDLKIKNIQPKDYGDLGALLDKKKQLDGFKIELAKISGNRIVF